MPDIHIHFDIGPNTMEQTINRQIGAILDAVDEHAKQPDSVQCVSDGKVIRESITTGPVRDEVGVSAHIDSLTSDVCHHHDRTEINLDMVVSLTGPRYEMVDADFVRRAIVDAIRRQVESIR